jgi:FtsH-binding integral membrane protein
MAMGMKMFIFVVALAGLVVGVIIRLAGWSEDFSHAFSLTMLAVVLLVCLPFFDPERDFGGGSRRR